MQNETQIDERSFIKEAIRIVDLARKNGIELRILGAVSFRIHTHSDWNIARPLTDLDFITYGKHRPKIRGLFERAGYQYDERQSVLHGLYRQVFHDDIHVDVFFDILRFCHTIEFAGRLEVDYPTIPLTEMMLEKMQIVKINEKDIKDTIMLLKDHDVGTTDHESINCEYLSKILSSDWGFYYTVTTNLEKVKEFLPKYEVLTEKGRMGIRAKIDRILEYVERTPKSLKWKMRAKIGTRKKWYEDVEELLRDTGV